MVASELEIPSTGKSDAAISDTKTQRTKISEDATSPVGTLLTEISLAQCVAALWLAGSLAAFFIVLYQATQLSRLIRSSRSVTDEVAGLVARLASELGLASVPRTRIVDADFSPLVWCLGRQPVVLLPAQLVEELEAEALQAVLAHELTHIARRDHRVRQLEVLVTVLYWWHPVVWWVRRELRRVEEECCDAQVLRLLPESAPDYADALVRTVEFVQSGRNQRSALASSRLGATALGSLSLASPLGRASHLRRRVEMILDERSRPRWTWSARLAVLSLAAVLPFSVQAQTESQQDEPQAKKEGLETEATSPVNGGPPAERTLTIEADQTESEQLPIQDADAAAGDDTAAEDSEKKSLDHRRDRPFGGIGFPNYGANWETLRLVTWKDCQDELGLDKEQRDELKPLLKKLYEGRKSWSKAGSDNKLFADEAEAARNILTRKQRKRLDQIILQRRGLPALFADDVVEALDLTANQRQIIDDAWAVHVQKAQDKVYKGTEGREGKYKVWHLALTTMTAKQRKQFKKMTGPIVELWPEPKPDTVVTGGRPEADPDAALDAKIHFRRDRPFGGIGFFEGNGFPDSYEFLKLVTYRPVQEELALNAGQQKELFAVKDALNKKYNAVELRKNPALLDNEYSQALEILTREQIKRVGQIMIQRDGMRALLDEKTQQKLGVSPKQAEGIRKAWTDHIVRGKAKYPGTTGRASAHQCWKDALLVLTEEQRAKFAEMTGEIVTQNRTPVSSSTSPGRMPPYVQHVWMWLPEGMESLHVARDFKIALGQNEESANGPAMTLPAAAQHAALGPMLQFDLMQLAKLNQDGSTTLLPHSPVLKPLYGTEIKWAITAGRKFEKNAETGLLRSESVSIVRFHRQPILALNAYLNSIRVFSEKWTLSGQEVLAVKADKLHQTSRHFLPPGQSYYVAQVDPSTIAVSTSDALMTQILRRRKVFFGSSKPFGELPRVFLPSKQTFWKHVRPTTQAWGFHQVPAGKDSSLHSLVWSCDFDNSRFEIVARVTRDGETSVRENLLELWDQDVVEKWQSAEKVLTVQLDLRAASNPSPLWMRSLNEMNALN